MNACEAENISETMIKQGWTRVSFEEVSDVAIIFTCAVTNMAASKSRKMMHRVKRLNPSTIVAMAGCYAQLNDGLLDEAEIIVGTSLKHMIPTYIQEYLQTHEKIRLIDEMKQIAFESMPVDHFENHSRGVLKIQDGCNQFCSYCIIPYVRGRERSLHPDQVIVEAKRIAQTHSEIVLTGIHTGRYGREYNVTLTELIERILKEVPQLKRLRISSIESNEVTNELIALMQKEPRIARHLHIPLQSGCNKTLAAMNRPYTTEKYYTKIEEIRNTLENCAISCDLIVGFPNETDEDFLETYAFLKKCQFAFLHVFPYSLRDGTKASLMPCQVDPKVKKERAQKCISLSNELQLAYAQKQIGKTAYLITEKSESTYTPGYTSDYISVHLENEKFPRGTMLEIKLTEILNGQMYGKVERVIEDEAKSTI